MKKIAVIIFLIIFVGTLYIVDQYFYSWSGWLGYQIGSCQSKSISASAVGKDGFTKLVYHIDLAEITTNLGSNPNYLIISDEKTVTFSRNFGALSYQITFKKNEDIIYYQFSALNRNSPQVEDCTTPDFEIYKKVYQMIEEIPLGDKPKRTILSGFNVYHKNSLETLQLKH